jgi:hypothetical protein
MRANTERKKGNDNKHRKKLGNGKTEDNKYVPGKVVEYEVLLQVGGQLEQGLSRPHHVGGSHLKKTNPRYLKQARLNSGRFDRSSGSQSMCILGSFSFFSHKNIRMFEVFI